MYIPKCSAKLALFHERSKIFNCFFYKLHLTMSIRKKFYPTLEDVGNPTQHLPCLPGASLQTTWFGHLGSSPCLHVCCSFPNLPCLHCILMCGTLRLQLIVSNSSFLRFHAYLCHVIDDFCLSWFAALRQVKNLTWQNPELISFAACRKQELFVVRVLIKS